MADGGCFLAGSLAGNLLSAAPGDRACLIAHAQAPMLCTHDLLASPHMYAYTFPLTTFLPLFSPHTPRARYLLVLLLTGLVVGCLTYEQLSTCSALAWPYSVRLCYMASDVHTLREDELATQQRLAAHTKAQAARRQQQQ